MESQLQRISRKLYKEKTIGRRLSQWEIERIVKETLQQIENEEELPKTVAMADPD